MAWSVIKRIPLPIPKTKVMRTFPLLLARILMSLAASMLIPPPKLRIPRCWGPSMLTECVGELRWRSLPAPDLTACVTSVEESSRSKEIYSQSR